MEQVIVLSLLEELASADCTLARREEIILDLCKAIAVPVVPDSPNDDTKGLFIMILKNVLQSACLESNKKHLKGLFPLVAMLCGDHLRHDHFANIDWSLLS